MFSRARPNEFHERATDQQKKDDIKGMEFAVIVVIAFKKATEI
jgi:hypothetical protein